MQRWKVVRKTSELSVAGKKVFKIKLVPDFLGLPEDDRISRLLSKEKLIIILPDGEGEMMELGGLVTLELTTIRKD